jgi:hypothetical protein
MTAREVPLLLVFALLLAAPSSAHAAERCRGPVVAGGQPALVAVVMDGISSQELESGTSAPLGVANWCPALPDGSERRLPAGLDNGFRVWSGLATVDGQKPQTTTCRPEGGLASDTCLVARLADAGAIVLPYSYAGARVAADGRFSFTGYTQHDTYQDPQASIARLDALIGSIARAWPSARVLVVAHSYGGTVASGWWETRAPGELSPVEHIVTLDSPINGVEQCAATALIFSVAVSKELCRRWNDRDAYDARLLELDHPRTLTTIGTPDDPSYEPPVKPDGTIQASGGGQLRAQVLYSKPDRVAAPPSVVNDSAECSGAGPGIQGRSGHFAVIACPQTTRTVLTVADTGAQLGDRVRPRRISVRGHTLRQVRWTAWGREVARGSGVLRGRRRAIRLSRLRPCDAVRRFTYRRAKVAGLRATERGYPSRAR